ncbi:hypothetical protein JCM11251_007518 [Rhodosporidiobolus azoricus]
MTSDAATPDFRSFLAMHSPTAQHAETVTVKEEADIAGVGDVVFDKALRELLNSPLPPASASDNPFVDQPAPVPFIPTASSTSSPPYFFSSPTFEPTFPTSAAMSFQDSTSSTTPSLRSAFSLLSPASPVSSCSPQALTRSPSAQSTSRPLAEQLESAVAILKAPKPENNKPKSTRGRRMPPGPRPVGSLPLPLLQPSTSLPPPPASTFVIPAPMHPRARTVTPVMAPVPGQQPAVPPYEPLFRPESPERGGHIDEEMAPLTPPSSCSLLPASLPLTPVELLTAHGQLEPSPQQLRREKQQAKRMAEGRIPRPPNAWMLYRSARVKEFAEREKQGGSRVTMQSDLSKIIGEMWRTEPLDVREAYAKLALAERDEHAKRYPEYVYKPVRKSSTNKRASSSSSAPSANPEPKRTRRPALKKAHTAPTNGVLLPPVEITDAPITANVFPSVLASTPATTTFSSTSHDIFDRFWTPPTTATSEAWSAFSTAPVAWHDAKGMDISSLQLDFGPPGPTTPFSAPATVSTFNFSFAPPSPPLDTVAGDGGASSSMMDLLKLDAMQGLPTPPPPPAVELPSCSSTSSSVLDEIMAALEKAPPATSTHLSAGPSSDDCLVLPPADSTASSTSPVLLSEEELDNILSQLSTAP